MFKEDLENEQLSEGNNKLDNEIFVEVDEKQNQVKDLLYKENNNSEITLEDLHKLSERGDMYFKNFIDITNNDKELVEYIVGRRLNISDFEESNYDDKSVEGLIFMSFLDFAISHRASDRRKVLYDFKNFLKNNIEIVFSNELIYRFFVKIDSSYIVSQINGIEKILNKKISEIDIDLKLVESLSILFNQFGNKEAIETIANKFKGEIIIDDFKVEEGNYENVLSKLLGSFRDLGEEKDSRILDNIELIEEYTGIKVFFEDIKELNKTQFDFFNYEIGKNFELEDFKFILGQNKGNITNLKDVFKLLNTFMRFGKKGVSNLIYLNSLFESNEDIEGIIKGVIIPITKSLISFLKDKDFNKNIIYFAFNKGLFTKIEDFLVLYNRRLFNNVNEDLFEKNYKYLEDNFGRKLDFNDFNGEYLVDFLKYADSDNFDFFVKEIHKAGLKGLDFRYLIRMISIEKKGFHIEYRHILSFISQPGLSKKIERFYKIKGEEFNIFEYFKNNHDYNDIDNISDNHNGGFDKFNEKYESKEEGIEIFSKNLEILKNKYPDLKLTKEIFKLCDKIGKNIFLFNKLDISFDYFKNMKIGEKNQDTKFIDFLINIDNESLNFIIDGIDNIKFKNLFSIYKVDKYLLTKNYKRYFFTEDDISKLILEFYNYSIKNNNYYFLKQNIETVIDYNYIEEENINSKEKLIKVLNKTGGFLTKSFFNNYILEENPKMNLDEMIEKYQNAMKKVLSSDKIKEEELDDFMYEAIFLAYRPTGFTEKKIREIIENGKIEDLTHQLEKIKFNKEGYKLSFNANKINYIGDLEKDNLLYIYSMLSNSIDISLAESLSIEREKIFNNINIKQFFSKTTELDKIDNIFHKFFLLNNDSRLEKFRGIDNLKQIAKINNDYLAQVVSKDNNLHLLNDYYKENVLPRDEDSYYIYLNDIYEVFGIVTKDSFYEVIKYELERLNESDLNFIFESIYDISDGKFKKELKKLDKDIVRNEDYSYQDKINIITSLTNKRIIEFGAFMRKKINKELKEFKKIKGEEKEFKGVISKNIASFFAKAGAELCTASDTKMWEEDRHIHLNLIDEEKQQVVGNIMLYFEEGRDYLIVRGFNPIREVESKYDNKVMVEEMVRIVKQIAKENGLNKVYIPNIENAWHGVTNRHFINKAIGSYILKNKEKEDYIIKNANFYQSSFEDNNIINKLYLL